MPVELATTNTRLVVANDDNSLDMVAFGLEHDHAGTSDMGCRGQATIGHDQQLGAGELAVRAVDGGIDL